MVKTVEAVTFGPQDDKEAGGAGGAKGRGGGARVQDAATLKTGKDTVE
jgi:hypothetical protein